jgi:chromosome segregation ATPase
LTPTPKETGGASAHTHQYRIRIAETLDDALTAAELDRHRIAETEKDVSELTAVVRSVEREVDRLKIEQASVIGAVSKLEGRLEERDKTLTASLARLHDRLDDRLREVAPISLVQAMEQKFSEVREQELRDEGARVKQRQMWQQWFRITGATTALGAVVIAGLALILH